MTDITAAPFGQNSLMSLFCFYYLYIYIFFICQKISPRQSCEGKEKLDRHSLNKRKFGQNGDQKFEKKLNKNRSLRALEMRHNSQCIRMDSGLWTVWWTDRV